MPARPPSPRSNGSHTQNTSCSNAWVHMPSWVHSDLPSDKTPSSRYRACPAVTTADVVMPPWVHSDLPSDKTPSSRYHACPAVTTADVVCLQQCTRRPRGPMDKASAYGAGDCRLESCRGHAVPALVLVRRRASAPQGPWCLLTRASRPAVRLFFAELRAPHEAYVCHSAPRGGAPAQRTRHRPTELEAVGSSPTGAMQLLR